ncbi:MAG: rRNA maturation RNase YbeY [Planctomycetota bacterium]|nr:rRNA maturation RNase YbeY [Planctomycetota bacterium]MDA1140882.1 rRNA maturation RNase YbeY [Planctomycetota bacterium]
MQIEIARNTDCSELDSVQLESWLKEEFDKDIDGTLSLAFVDNAAISEVNEQYLQHEGPTDVISFLLAEEGSPNPENQFGELVISIEMARQEAAARGLTLQEETFRYCVHGILHLLGYDDQTDEDASEMRQEQEQIVARHCHVHPNH